MVKYRKNVFTLYSVIKLLHNFGKPYGLAPYTMNELKQRKGKIFFTILHIVLSLSKYFSLLLKSCFVLPVCMLIGLSIMMGYSYMIVYYHSFRNRPKIYVMLLVILGFKVLSSCIITQQFLVKRILFIKAIEMLREVDVQIKQLKRQSPTYFYHYIFFMFVCSAIPMYHTTFLLIKWSDGEDIYPLLLNFFGSEILNGVYVFVTYYYMLYVYILYQRFSFINETLGGLNNLENKRALVLLNSVIKMHQNLCKGAKHLNEMFSVPLFLIILCQLVEFVLLCYMVYQHEEVVVSNTAIWYAMQLILLLLPTRLVITEVT